MEHQPRVLGDVGRYSIESTASAINVNDVYQLHRNRKSTNRMSYSTLRMLCTVLLVAICLPPACFAQDANSSAIPSEWTKCKQDFLTEIDKSHALILSQFETQETILRNEGELEKLKTLRQILALFVEKGEIHSSLFRTEYDQIREHANKQLASSRKELVVKALQHKEDSIAELIDNEFNELSDSLIADVQARWSASITAYEKSCESAKSLIVKQLDKIEANARISANPDLVARSKSAKTSFIENGIVPPNVSRTAYNAELKKAREQLEQLNKSLVRTLLINKYDDKAKEISDELALAMNHDANTSGIKLQRRSDNRKSWENKSYNTVFYYRQGDAWEEINRSGKLERNVKELSRNDDYIEILLLDRQHRMRLYSERADMFRDGRWQWVANGNWISK